MSNTKQQTEVKQIKKYLELPHRETVISTNTIQTKPFDNQKINMSNNKQSSVDMEFVPYKQALALKELGFDEPCNTCYDKLEMVASCGVNVFDYKNYNTSGYIVSRPTFSQAFRWFRYKYWYTALILCDSFQIVMQLSTSKTLDSKTGEYITNYSTQTYHKEVGLKSHDEAELECLKKLIEIANEQQ
jgi:hypothetical protein